MAKYYNITYLNVILSSQALPPTVESRCEVKRLNEVLVGAHYDAEYGLQFVQVHSNFKAVVDLEK